VIELSVDETNKLRAELGLAPLRLNSNKNSNNDDGGDDSEAAVLQESVPGSGGEQQNTEEVLEMSVDETNALRAKLGLKPLRSGSSTKKEAVHKPAENDGDSKEVRERLERAKLQRDVQKGVATTFGNATLADEGKSDALSWAERMRMQQASAAQEGTKSKKGQNNKQAENSNNTEDENYSQKELEGLQVAHNLAELEAGSTTVLTLADAPLLETKANRQVVGLNEGEVALENVNLTEQKKQQDGLRKKRLLEMGLGRAGGYSGFDDEEFEELGGTLGPARKDRGNPDYESGDEGAPKAKGFRIGAIKGEGEDELTDFDKISSGKAISLQSEKPNVAASDYMTLEEEQEERAKKKKKKDGKFKKKKKKEKKKKRSRTKVEDSDDDDDVDAASANKTNAHNLLEQLEQTAVENDDPSTQRKRRRSESEDEAPNNGFKQVDTTTQQPGDQKRSRYDEIMKKGNERTKQAFEEKPKVVESSAYDEEPDDSFLNAALEKARRLNRLRELNKTRKKGAEAVADAVQSIKQEEPSTTQSSGKLTFAIDDTREFTRAIRARSQQKEREAQKAAKQQAKASNGDEKVKQEEKPALEDAKVEDVESEDEAEDVNMEELAKEVKVDDVPSFGAAATDSAGVGRGLSSFVSLLKQTGEISAKRGKKEELRGRAKDERNYENYQAMDLSKVVKIGRNATDKDKELAEREIKLEYRDKHGRLLTQKEAFRDLCYQFHGHGASKKKEEKRLKQITREQAEARLASRQVVAARDGTAAGTLGALKATQKATGKAFIVHKT